MNGTIVLAADAPADLAAFCGQLLEVEPQPVLSTMPGLSPGRLGDGWSGHKRCGR
jgi:hypothetical protein